MGHPVHAFSLYTSKLLLFLSITCFYNQHLLISGDISKEETISKIFEAVETLVTEKNLNLRVIVHSAGTGKPGKHQKLTDGSMFHQENQNSIDFEDYDFYQSVYPKVICVTKLDFKNM